MPIKPVERLLFAQGGRCFFCNQPLSKTDATVEHLVARANGGADHDENCVACCAPLNALLGKMSLKEKLRVVLNQSGEFRCPAHGKQPVAPAPIMQATPSAALSKAEEQLQRALLDLRKRGTAKPRKLATLKTTLAALFKSELTEAQVDALIRALVHRQFVAVDGDKVSYTLPA